MLIAHTDIETAEGWSVPRAWISSATFYKWKSKYGGLDVSDACRPKTLEEENARLKTLMAEAMLDNAILKDAAAKKWWRPT